MESGITEATQKVIDSANFHATFASITMSVVFTIFFLWLLRLSCRKGLSPLISALIGVISLGIICFLGNAAAVYAFSFTYRPYVMKALSSSSDMSFTTPEFGWVPLWEHHDPMANIMGFAATGITLITWSLIAWFTRKQLI